MNISNRSIYQACVCPKILLEYNLLSFGQDEIVDQGSCAVGSCALGFGRSVFSSDKCHWIAKFLTLSDIEADEIFVFFNQ